MLILKLTRWRSGIFSQSNYGIVTKMGFGLMPNPGGHESFVSLLMIDFKSNANLLLAALYFQK